MPELVTPRKRLSALELVAKRTSGIFSRSFLSLHTAFDSTDPTESNFQELLKTQNLIALLVWCKGSIATFTKLPVRVQFPSPTPQSHNLLTDLLVVIVKLGKLSKSLEETRGSFTLYVQHPRQPRYSLMQPHLGCRDNPARGMSFRRTPLFVNAPSFEVSG